MCLFDEVQKLGAEILKLRQTALTVEINSKCTCSCWICTRTLPTAHPGHCELSLDVTLPTAHCGHCKQPLDFTQ